MADRNSLSAGSNLSTLPVYHYYMDPSESYMIWVKAFIGGMFVGSILGLNLCFALLVGYFVFSTKTEFFREKIISCLNHYQASIPVGGSLASTSGSLAGVIGDGLKRGSVSISSFIPSSPPSPISSTGPPAIPVIPSPSGETAYGPLSNLLFGQTNLTPQAN